MKTILGKKVGMTQIFSDAGEVVPVTVVEAGPAVVTQVKTAPQSEPLAEAAETVGRSSLTLPVTK